ncbi:uncharacterized protein [Chanodichthys erythropterus]|uniref:uncharacterized protein n=1 Tax=Chanodichthys erythropterus TaxID=933992 RepID=UPI00351DC1C6
MENEATDLLDVPLDDSQKDVGTQWEDRSLGDHSYSSSHPLMPLITTADQGSQCDKLLHKSLLRTDALSLLHTGLSRAAYYSVAEHFIPLYKGNFQLDPTDQLLLTLMKLKLNLLQDDLAKRFSVSQGVVSQVLSCWIDLMEENMRQYIPWLPKETISAKMPQCFKEYHPGTTCIIDCSETPLQRARSLDSRAESFSHYYAQNTIKYLVAIAPCGLIMFISPVYGGRSSDKFITCDSGFLEYLRSGDEVMADRGFTIRDVLSERKVKLTIPAFTKRGAQLSEEDTTSTRRIANVRIHLEWIICILKHFRIISQIVPINLASKLDKILRICAALCNLQGDIIYEDAE